MTATRHLLPALLALAASACARADAGDRPRVRDVLVLLLDALPARGVGCYGYERDVTPELDRFARGAIRLDAAYAQASYTLSSVASLFTGLTAPAHGSLGDDSNVLADAHRTLAEAFAAEGFATLGVSCNPHVAPEAGFGQGFDRFRYVRRERFDAHVVPEGVGSDLVEWWGERSGERRFAYLHLLPPHQPYDPPAPHDRRFGADAVAVERGRREFLQDLNRERRAIDPGEPVVAEIRARYDAGLRYVDGWVGSLLGELEREGALADALVVVLSDHGEAFGEHGRILHGSTVFEEMTRVPVLLRWPGVDPGAFDGPVGVRDLAPTICELAGVPWPEDGRRGASIVGRLLGEGGEARAVLSRSTGSRPMWALRTEEWVYLRQGSSGLELLHDRRADPGERVDLSGRRPEVVERLRAELDGVLAEERALRSEIGAEARSVDAHREELEALGYLESDE